MVPGLVQRLNGGPLAVETRGLAKRFDDRTALDGLDLTVPAQSVYVLVGPNGAGKTTTLRILLDLVRADRGEVHVFGLSQLEAGVEIRAEVGYVPEVHDFGYGDLSVSRLFAHHARYFTRWDPDYADRLIRALGIDLDVPYGHLSKGQARRVQIVMALAHRPRLLLLDEPTDGLDPLARDLVFELLAEHLASTPTTVLVSTHLVHDLEGLSDCLGVLRSGRLVAQQRRSELVRHLYRIQFDVPEGWTPPEELDGTLLRSKGGARERVCTVWGDPEGTRAALQAAGATVRHIASLNLEDAARTLLRSEVP